MECDTHLFTLTFTGAKSESADTFRTRWALALCNIGESGAAGDVGPSLLSSG